MNKNIQTIKKILSKESKKKYKFYFVGIGGVSMFSLAILMLSLGMEVSGTDVRKSKNTKNLQRLGANIYFSHKPENIRGADFVIYSYAVENCVEAQEAKRLNIPTLSRAKLLGLFLECFETVVAISGAHGKSTTTALIYHILNCAQKNPCLHLGACLQANGKCFNHDDYLKAGKGKGGIIVCEACEYKDAFLNLKPNIAVVLNMAPEHLDYFKSFEGVVKSFIKFAKSANVLICTNEQQISHPNLITFGGNGATFSYGKIKTTKQGITSFSCNKNGRFFAKIETRLVGLHNVKNIIASIAVCQQLGVGKKQIVEAIKTFSGIERRFEILNKNIIHDYAHHPEEIKAVLTEYKKISNKKICVVFQPHTYTRTKSLMPEFVCALKNAERIATYRTYSAREKYMKGATAKDLATKIGRGATYINNKQDLKKYVLSKVKQNYAVFFLGAGSIYTLAKNIAKLCWQCEVYMLNSNTLN